MHYLYRAFGEESVLSGSSANRFTWVGSVRGNKAHVAEADFRRQPQPRQEVADPG